MKNRKFSIPYSFLCEPLEYIKMITPYKEYIHSIFVGIPELKTHLSINAASVERFKNVMNENSSKEFLELSKGLYKRIIPYNSTKNESNTKELYEYFEKNIYPIIEKYSIDGFILTNFGLARKLHQDFPKLEIHTSCNGYHFTKSAMEHWREYAGVSLFNPPREAARNPEMLKDLHESGFSLKVIVNEACMYGCVQRFNSCGTCMNFNPVNAFKTNLFLPRWLEDIDEYVSIYKLAGRMETLDRLKSIFDAYILQKPFQYINDIVVCKTRTNPIKVLENEFNIKIKEIDIPDNIRYCKNDSCFTNCTICNTLLKNYMTEEQIEIYRKKYDPLNKI